MLIFKYIVTKHGAVLFNEATTHSQVAEGFDKNIFSAGFVKIEFDSIGNPIIEPHGYSESLKIGPNVEADKIIIGDLFCQMSQIKYFGMNVEALYKK